MKWWKCNYLGNLLLIIILLSVVFSVSSVDKGTKKILIITSYAGDSKRVTDFLGEFDSVASLKRNKYKYEYLMENMQFRGLSFCNIWPARVKSTLKKHEKENISGIILLGQEAWGTYLGLDTIPDIPFYGCMISENGLIIPDTIKNANYFNPNAVNTMIVAKKKGRAGGIMNRYDIKKNIELIQSFYPSVDKIAFLSDNTYGGLSIQKEFIRIMSESFPKKQMILLDGRINDVQHIKNQINKLDKNSAVLLGTWRVDCTGSYFMQSSAYWSKRVDKIGLIS